MKNVLIEAVDRPIDEFYRFAESYSAKEGALLLIRQLNRLIKTVQRHRGISMALLAGSLEYREELVTLQTQLERRLATLEAFASVNRLLSDNDKLNLAHAWVTIRNDWEDDNLNDNFELHSHLIQQLLTMIQDLAMMLKMPFSEQRSAKALEQDGKMGVLLDFVCSTLPVLIEDIARIRGATSYVVAVGGNHGLDESKIRFWMASAKEKCAAVGEQVADLELLDQGASFKQMSMKHTELTLLKLLDVVDSVAFQGHASHAGSKNIFNLATEVMQRYWAIVNLGLNIIQSWHLEELNDWVEAP